MGDESHRSCGVRFRSPNRASPEVEWGRGCRPFPDRSGSADRVRRRWRRALRAVPSSLHCRRPGGGRAGRTGGRRPGLRSGGRSHPGRVRGGLPAVRDRPRASRRAALATLAAFPAGRWAPGEPHRDPGRRRRLASRHLTSHRAGPGPAGGHVEHGPGDGSSVRTGGDRHTPRSAHRRHPPAPGHLHRLLSAGDSPSRRGDAHFGPSLLDGAHARRRRPGGLLRGRALSPAPHAREGGAAAFP